LQHPTGAGNIAFAGIEDAFPRHGNGVHTIVHCGLKFLQMSTKPALSI